MRKCYCPDWSPNVKFIHDRIEENDIFAYAYSLTPFQFCPWCGRKLKEEGDGETTETGNGQ